MLKYWWSVLGDAWKETRRKWKLETGFDWVKLLAVPIVAAVIVFALGQTTPLAGILAGALVVALALGWALFETLGVPARRESVALATRQTLQDRIAKLEAEHENARTDLTTTSSAELARLSASHEAEMLSAQTKWAAEADALKAEHTREAQKQVDEYRKLETSKASLEADLEALRKSIANAQDDPNAIRQGAVRVATATGVAVDARSLSATVERIEATARFAPALEFELAGWRMTLIAHRDYDLLWEGGGTVGRYGRCSCKLLGRIEPE